MAGLLRADRGLLTRSIVQLIGCVFVAAIIPYLLRLFTLPFGETPELLRFTLITSVAAIFVGTWLLRSLTTYPGVEESAYVVPALSVSFGILILILIMLRLPYNRLLILSGYLLSIVWFYFVYFATQRHRFLRVGLVPFGAVDALQEIDRVQWVPLGTVDAAIAGLDAIAADLRIDLPNEWDSRLADYALEGMPVYHVKNLIESLTGRVELEHLSENSLGSLAPTTSWIVVKYALDWSTAVILMVVLLPFLLAVGLLVRVTSPGPALFRQRRIGYRGQPFTVYKFRTMTVPESATNNHRHTAITQANDDRITPFGRYLRRTRVDELPQVFNILRGEMSWIGPRPEAEVLSAWYQSEIPFYKYRHIVRPGVTGWAQVSQGHVAQVDEVKAKSYYDFFYIKHFSPWIDVLIIARTFRTVFTGFGSK